MPRPDLRRAQAVSAGLLLAWLVVTLFARPVTARVVIPVAEWGERFLGLDKSQADK